jgi:uncharacterized protein HemY
MPIPDIQRILITLTELFVVVLLFIVGVKLASKPSNDKSYVKVDLANSFFEINTASAGLILCFLGFILLIVIIGSS